MVKKSFLSLLQAFVQDLNISFEDISPQEVMHDEAFIASQILDEYFIRERIRVNLIP